MLDRALGFGVAKLKQPCGKEESFLQLSFVEVMNDSNRHNIMRALLYVSISIEGKLEVQKV